MAAARSEKTQARGAQEGQSAAQQRPGAQPQTSGKMGADETPLWEKLVGVLGLLIVLGVVGFLLYEAFQPQTEPEIVTEVKAIAPQAGGYLVEFEASNYGRKTAASVAVEAALYAPGDTAGEPVETAEITFDYIPDQSDRSGAFVFEHDPRQYELRLQVKGFMDP